MDGRWLGLGVALAAVAVGAVRPYAGGSPVRTLLKTPPFASIPNATIFLSVHQNRHILTLRFEVYGKSGVPVRPPNGTAFLWEDFTIRGDQPSAKEFAKVLARAKELSDGFGGLRIVDSTSWPHSPETYIKARSPALGPLRVAQELGDHRWLLQALVPEIGWRTIDRGLATESVDAFRKRMVDHFGIRKPGVDGVTDAVWAHLPIVVLGGKGSAVRTGLAPPNYETITDLRFPGNHWRTMEIPSPGKRLNGWARYEELPKTVIAWGELQGPRPGFDIGGAEDLNFGLRMANFLAADLLRFVERKKKNFRWPASVGVFVSPNHYNEAVRTVFLADTDVKTAETSDYLMSVVSWLQDVDPAFVRDLWNDARALGPKGSPVRTALRSPKKPGIPVRLLLVQIVDNGVTVDRITLQVRWAREREGAKWLNLHTIRIPENFPRREVDDLGVLPDVGEIQKIFAQEGLKIRILYRPGEGALINERVLAEGDNDAQLPIAIGLPAKGRPTKKRKPIYVLVLNLLNSPPGRSWSDRLLHPEEWVSLTALPDEEHAMALLRGNQIDPLEVPRLEDWPKK